MGAPTGIEPLRGIRTWSLSPMGPSLVSPTTWAHTRWPPAAPLTAACTPWAIAPGAAWDAAEHPVPAETCGCGIYARKPGEWDPSWERAALRAGVQVMGEVDLWGRVLEGSRGFRAEHARVVALYEVWEEDLGGWLLAERYAVPVVAAPPWVTARLGRPDGSEAAWPSLRTHVAGLRASLGPLGHRQGARHGHR